VVRRALRGELRASLILERRAHALSAPEVHEPRNFRTKIVKTTCTQADSILLNDLRLTGIPFICRVHITSRMRFADQKVETLMRAVFVLPWYLRFLESTAHSVVTSSFDDEIQATVHQLCGSSLPPAPPPPVVVAPLQPPSAYSPSRAAATRRRRAAAAAVGVALSEWC